MYLCVSNEFQQIVGGQILARTKQRCLSNQHDWREIGSGIIVELYRCLICGMGAHIAEHELIAVPNLQVLHHLLRLS